MEIIDKTFNSFSAKKKNIFQDILRRSCIYVYNVFIKKLTIIDIKNFMNSDRQ